MADVCDHCGHSVALNEAVCPVCGKSAGFPNVKEAEQVAETVALDQRYDQAVRDAQARSAGGIAGAFESVLINSYAVFNADPEFVDSFLTNSKTLYASYGLQVRSQVRRVAALQDDKARHSVEGAFFGSYAEEIRYAALSLGGPGVISYGALAVRLQENAIAHRATLLEQNTYHFCKQHDLRLLQPIPCGFRATWANRAKLAVTKLANRLTATTLAQQFPALLLHSVGDRATDEFIEVHIYGRLNESSVVEVSGSTPSKRSRNGSLISKIKDMLNKTGRKWLEV
mgnify:CR=1 FL=1